MERKLVPEGSSNSSQRKFNHGDQLPGDSEEQATEGAEPDGENQWGEEDRSAHRSLSETKSQKI